MDTSRKRAVKTSAHQYEFYCDFLEEHSVLRTVKLQSGVRPEHVEDLWRELTAKLNSCGTGAVKDVKGWKTVSTGIYLMPV